ncbi:MAG TPA: DUF2157 domain-containing protein [Vicinamibacterales bacterium]|nr:DUF2157 domain-containing protein [Vicinamibacterales bacterium]
MTAERYLEEWRTAEIITAEQHALLLALVRRQRFSIFLELNALLYLGVVAIAGGIAWTVEEHVASIGDPAIIVSLTIVFAGCLWYCFSRAAPYSHERVAAPTFSFDYVLYLGCLVFAAEVAFLEYRFRLLGDAWDNYLLASAALYFALAYRFDNRFVLSLALSTLGAWFGVRLSTSAFFAGSMREIAIVYGALVAAAGVAAHRQRIKPHFLETYLHVAANAILFGLASAVVDRGNTLWLAALLAACGAAIASGIRFRRFAFVVYGVVYAYAGISAKALTIFHRDVSVLAYFTISAAAVVAGLVLVARWFGREE